MISKSPPRAWNLNNKRMYMVETIEFLNQNATISSSPWRHCIPLTEIILLWPTGLKDKNGQEIYEGDVVKMMGEDIQIIGQVVWDVDGFIVSFQEYVETEPCMEANFAYVGAHDWEILGNKWQNPELLKEK